MLVNKTTVKIQASYNYQVASLEVELEDYTNEELQEYTQYLVETCSNTVKNISAAVGPTHTDSKPVVKTQIEKNSNYQQPNAQYNRAPRVANTQYPTYQPQPAQGPQVRFASEKQLQYLRSFGWNGNPQGLTWSDADMLLKQYKGQ